jgi:hypothetical protein
MKKVEGRTFVWGQGFTRELCDDVSSDDSAVRHGLHDLFLLDSVDGIPQRKDIGMVGQL